MSDLYLDPFTPELRDDPYPLWKRMRDEAPVWHNEQYDFWVLTRFHDIEHANKDHETFSSNHGTTVETMTEAPVVDTGMIIWCDPPKHTMLRKLVSRAFTSRRVSSPHLLSQFNAVRPAPGRVDPTGRPRPACPRTP